MTLKSQKGKTTLFKLQDGVDTDGSPKYITVAGQQGGTLNQSMNTMDATTKDSNSQELYPTFLEWSIDADGLVKIGDTGFKRMLEAFYAGEEVMVQFVDENLYVFEGKAIITEVPIEASHDDFGTWSITAQGTGDLKFTYKLDATE